MCSMNTTNVTICLDLLGLFHLHVPIVELLKSCSKIQVMHHITRPHELVVDTNCQLITKFATQAMKRTIHKLAAFPLISASCNKANIHLGRLLPARIVLELAAWDLCTEGFFKCWHCNAPNHLPGLGRTDRLW